jgi:hypothetical protein
LTRRGITHLRITTEIANKDNFMKHGDLLSDGGLDLVLTRVVRATYSSPIGSIEQLYY